MGSGMVGARFVIILVLNNPEISKINKENSNQMRILVLIGANGFTESTN